MGSTAFRDLIAHRRSLEIADGLHAAVTKWSRFERWSVGLQLVRSVDSIGANIAEAVGRWHQGDRRRLLSIARGSLYETEHWILRAEARGLLDSGKAAELDEVARALNGLIKRGPPN